MRQTHRSEAQAVTLVGVKGVRLDRNITDSEFPTSGLTIRELPHSLEKRAFPSTDLVKPPTSRLLDPLDSSCSTSGLVVIWAQPPRCQEMASGPTILEEWLVTLP